MPRQRSRSPLSPILATESATVRLFFILSVLLCSVNKAGLKTETWLLYCLRLRSRSPHNAKHSTSIYLYLCRLLRASFSPIFQYFSAVNVPRVSFSPIFQYFLTCMPRAYAMDSSAHMAIDIVPSNRGLLLNQQRREARLQQVRSAQDRRIATESAEEREASLQQLRVAQQQRVSAESAEEREARLHQLRVVQQQMLNQQRKE